MKDPTIKFLVVILVFVVSPALADGFEVAFPLSNNCKVEFPSIMSRMDAPIRNAHLVDNSCIDSELALQGNTRWELTFAKTGLFRATLIVVNSTK